MNQQEIYNQITDNLDDNKKLWAMAGRFAETHRALEKAKESLGAAQAGNVDLEDKARLKEMVMTHLLRESSNGNAQASDKLARLAGLGETEQDITIEVISYKDYIAKEESE